MSGNPAQWEKLSDALLQWYKKGHRDLPWRQEPTPYHVWISEIMLQQTRVEAVRAYYARFIAELPDIPDLAAVDEGRLLKLWEGLGYYSRARNLKKAAQQIMERHQGQLPANRDALLKLAGVGPYTAGAIASIAYGLPVAAVDGNVLRVWARVCNEEADIALPETKSRVTKELDQVLHGLSGNPGDFNQAFMELGAVVCVPNGPPKCLFCPVADWCGAKAAGTALFLPVKTPKKPRRVEERMVFVLECGGQVALHKRPAKGLLAGLWELPNVAGTGTENDVADVIRSWGLEPLEIVCCGNAKHIFTHVEWRMTGYHVIVKQASGTHLQWAGKADLNQYALPSAFRYFFPFQ